MQVISEDKQQVLKDFCKGAMDDQYLFFSYWLVFVFAESNKGASQWNEICSTLAPTQFYSRTFRFHSRTRKVWEEICSIFWLRKRIWQDVCMLENRVFSPLFLTLILYAVSMMLLFSLRLSYMTTTSDLYGEMLPPCSSLSHDINAIVLNMQPRMWVRLT